MTDIVERLRQRDEYDAVLDHENRVYGLAKSLEHEAADEIERLRAEVERLNEALIRERHGWQAEVERLRREVLRAGGAS